MLKTSAIKEWKTRKSKEWKQDSVELNEEEYRAKDLEQIAPQVITKILMGCLVNI